MSDKTNDREALKRVAEVASVKHLEESLAEYRAAIDDPSAEPGDWELEFWHAGYKRGALALIDHQLTTPPVYDVDKIAEVIEGLDWAAEHGGNDPSSEEIARAVVAYLRGESK